MKYQQLDFHYMPCIDFVHCLFLPTYCSTFLYAFM